MISLFSSEIESLPPQKGGLQEDDELGYFDLTWWGRVQDYRLFVFDKSKNEKQRT